MNTCKALLFILLAWSTTQLTPQLGTFNSENDPISQVFSGLDADLQIPDFDLLFNEESAEGTTVLDLDSFIDNMQYYLLDTLTGLMEENIEESFFNGEFSTLFETDNREDEISLADLTTSFEEAEEALALFDQLSRWNKNTEELLFENFNEELTYLLNLYENAENTEEIVVIPSAVSGIAFSMVDGLNGVDGEEEKGEENLEAKYNLAMTEDRFNLVGGSKTFDINLAAICFVIAVIITGVVAKGLGYFRKQETVSEEDSSNNYVAI